MEMETMGNTMSGFNLEVFLMSASGIFYIICAAFLWKKVKKSEGNELTKALLAFLVYQAVNMFFMGLEMYTHEMLYSNIAVLSVFIGSAYMVKFPTSSFSSGTRKSIFYMSLAVLLGLFIWFMYTEERQMMLMNFALWYDLAINGLLVGGFMLGLAIRTEEKILKAKALGGGTGVVSCCVVANGAMLGGAMLTSSLFGFLAPVFILGSLWIFDKPKVDTSAIANHE